MNNDNIKTVYTQCEVKAMMRAGKSNIAAIRLDPEPYIDIVRIYSTIDDVQDQFSQILRILNPEYNEICEDVEAIEREEQKDGTDHED